MTSFIKVKIGDRCADCPHENEDMEQCGIFGQWIDGFKRCQACLDADITNSSELHIVDMLQEIDKHVKTISILRTELACCEGKNERLKQRNRVLERARELVKEDFCTATFEASLKKAKKEYESEAKE